MLADVQSSYGLARPFHGAGNFETEHQRNLVREVCAAVQTGRLIVVSGLVGSGKTHLLRRIEDELVKAGKVAVAKSLAVDKRRTSLPSLIEALFYDLSPGDRAQVKIPKQAERRERDLRDIMRKGKRPVVLVVDEAHDLLVEAVPLVDHRAALAVVVQQISVRVADLPVRVEGPLHVRRHAEAVHGADRVHNTIPLLVVRHAHALELGELARIIQVVVVACAR